MAGQIRQFVAQGELNPTDRGSTARAIAAGHVESEYNKIGNDVSGAIDQAGKQYVQQRTQEQSLKALQLTAKTQELATASWADAVAKDAASDVHNPNLAQDWQKTFLTPALDAIGGTLDTKEGQDWWAEHRLNVEQHFSERNAADVSSLAGVHALTSFEESQKSSENLTYMDPSSGNLARGNLQTAKELALRQLAVNGPISVEAAAQIEAHFNQGLEAVTLAQGRGLIDKAADPVAAYKDFVSKPEAITHLTDNQRNSLSNYADATASQNEVKAKAAVVQQRKDEDDAADVVVSKIQTLVQVQPDGTYKVDPAAFDAIKVLNNLPGAQRNPEKVRALSAWLEHAATQKPAVVDEPTMYSDFVQRAVLPDGDPRKLTQNEIFLAAAAGKITPQHVNMFQEQIKPDADPGMKQLDKDMALFMEDHKAQFKASDALAGSANPIGDHDFWQFQRYVEGLKQSMLARGLKPAEVDAQLLDPKSRAFIGAHIAAFKQNHLSGPDHIAAIAASRQPPAPATAAGPAPAAPAVAPGVVPALKGETPEQYDARVARGGH